MDEHTNCNDADRRQELSFIPAEQFTDLNEIPYSFSSSLFVFYAATFDCHRRHCTHTHTGRLHARTLQLLTCSFSSHGFFSPFFVTADRSDRIHHEHESARACKSSAVSLVFTRACIGTTFRIEYTLNFWPTRMKSIDIMNSRVVGCSLCVIYVVQHRLNATTIESDVFSCWLNFSSFNIIRTDTFAKCCF